MKYIINSIICLAAGFGVGWYCGCTRPPHLPKAITAMTEINSAEQFLMELAKQRDLVGVPKQSHGGDLHADNNPDTEAAAAKYPILLSFTLVLTGDSSTNHYMLMRSSPGAAWQLQKAWRTDSQGDVIKQWPVKSLKPVDEVGQPPDTALKPMPPDSDAK